MLNMVSKLNITYEYLEPSKNWSFEAARVHVVRWADAKANAFTVPMWGQIEKHLSKIVTVQESQLVPCI